MSKFYVNGVSPAVRGGGVLFTAGPICTSTAVRNAQTVDYGSRDKVFISAVKEIRSKLLHVGCCDPSEWASIIMQGSGTMGVEAVINSTAKRGPDANYLVVRNGAYGARMASVVEKLGLPLITFDVDEGKEVDLVKFQEFISSQKKNVTNFGVVHCETSTGMFNPIHGISRLVRRSFPTSTIFVDAMSSFGGVQFKVPDVCDILVTSSNKCIQGIPGFSIVLAKKSLLEAYRGQSTSYTLDVVKQYDGLEQNNGQFNNTPPVQAIMAFLQALQEHEKEGGTTAREERYKEMSAYISSRMQDFGFSLFLDPRSTSFGHIITAFNSPVSNTKWNFSEFYSRLNVKGFVIYPGKASKADTFRIGSLGDISMDDCRALMNATEEVMQEMNLILNVK